MSEQTSYEIGLDRDNKIREKISADQAHKDLKQEYITIQFSIAKLKVELKEVEGLLILNRSDIDLRLKANALKKNIAELRVTQKDLEGKLNKSRFVIKKLTDEIEILKNQFFSAKDSGI